MINILRTVNIILFITLSAVLINCNRTVLRELSSTDILKENIAEIFEDPNFYVANWGVYIESLETGEVIFRQNPYKLFMPASNMKLFTTSAVLARLGPDYTYKTRLLKRGEITKEGVLEGDLLVIGAGDPTFSGRFSEDRGITYIFDNWAGSLKAAGINIVNGDIIGSGSVFDNNFYGGGWEYDDLQFAYAAPVAGLSFNENAILIVVKPGTETGAPAKITLIPDTKFVSIINKTNTINPTRIQQITATRKIGTNEIVVAGTISTDRNQVTRNVSIENPVVYTLEVFKETLELNGITVKGKKVVIVEKTDMSAIKPEWTQIATYHSPKMSEILKVVNKSSNNFYAEQLLKTLGFEFTGLGSFDSGAEVVRRFLRGIGINTDQFFQYDGSGLSRHNLVMPHHIATLLKYMRRHPQFDVFYESLPIAGVDGTIVNRMRYTAAETVAHAKTGTIHYVRALSGYVTSKDGEEFVVSILVNNYTTPSSTSAAIQDHIFVLLANFSR